MVKDEYIAESGLLIVRISGDYILSEGTKVVEKYISILKDKKCKKCLIDYRKANYIMDSIGLIQRTQLMDKLKLSRDVKLAALFNEISENVIYFEAVLQNRGWRAKAFIDEKKAIDWLES